MADDVADGSRSPAVDEPEAPFLLAARGQRPPHTPVWFMRQAGRSLPEYRRVRGEGSILHAIAQPDVAAEITLQPVRRYGVDAAVLYSDIVVPIHASGFPIDVAPGTGPVAETPVRSSADVERIRPLRPDDVAHVAETVRIVSRELPATVPVLAFAGAPFTVASYLVEGRPSRTYENVKAMMRSAPEMFDALLERLAEHAVTFIDVQLSSGARAFQLFDSWAGTLSRADYDRHVRPHTASVFAGIAARHPGVPGIHFGIGCDHLLESIATTGAGIIGLDWRTPLRAARHRLGADTVLQGNLDPALALAGPDVGVAAALDVLADNGGHAGHIFNLGHGVHPQTDPDVLAEITSVVHDRTSR